MYYRGPCHQWSQSRYGAWVVHAAASVPEGKYLYAGILDDLQEWRRLSVEQGKATINARHLEPRQQFGDEFLGASGEHGRDDVEQH